VFHEFMTIVNLVFRKLIAWPMGTKTNNVMENFKKLCGLPSMHKAIHGIHIIIFKLFFSSKIIVIIQRMNIPLLVKSLLIITKHFLMFVLDCWIISMILKFNVGLFYFAVNIKICLILIKVWKIFICICWGMKDMGVNQLNNTKKNLILFHYPNSLSF
jgi:hypothetical protein